MRIEVDSEGKTIARLDGIKSFSYETSPVRFINSSFSHDVERTDSVGIKVTDEGVKFEPYYLVGSGYATVGEEPVVPLQYTIKRAGTATAKPKSDSAELKARFKRTFRSIVENEVFEFGVKSAAENYVDDFLKRKPNFTKNCLNELYLEFAVESDQLAIAVLKVLAHSDRDTLYPVADTVAIAALSHESLEVRECGVRAFEYWESPAAIGVLERTRLEPIWLEEYKNEVIRDIREQQ